MKATELEGPVRSALDQARATLGTIEMTVRETGDQAPLLEASRQYARLCMSLREYLSGLQMRRPSPQRLANHVDEVRTALAQQWAGLGAVDPRPDLADLARLRDLARSVDAV